MSFTNVLCCLALLAIANACVNPQQCHDLAQNCGNDCDCWQKATDCYRTTGCGNAQPVQHITDCDAARCTDLQCRAVLVGQLEGCYDLQALKDDSIDPQTVLYQKPMISLGTANDDGIAVPPSQWFDVATPAHCKEFCGHALQPLSMVYQANGVVYCACTSQFPSSARPIGYTHCDSPCHPTLSTNGPSCTYGVDCCGADDAVAVTVVPMSGVSYITVLLDRFFEKVWAKLNDPLKTPAQNLAYRQSTAVAGMLTGYGGAGGYTSATYADGSRLQDYLFASTQDAAGWCAVTHQSALEGFRTVQQTAALHGFDPLYNEPVVCYRHFHYTIDGQAVGACAGTPSFVGAGCVPKSSFGATGNGVGPINTSNLPELTIPRTSAQVYRTTELSRSRPGPLCASETPTAGQAGLCAATFVCDKTAAPCTFSVAIERSFSIANTNTESWQREAGTSITGGISITAEGGFDVGFASAGGGVTTSFEATSSSSSSTGGERSTEVTSSVSITNSIEVTVDVPFGENQVTVQFVKSQVTTRFDWIQELSASGDVGFGGTIAGLPQKARLPLSMFLSPEETRLLLTGYFDVQNQNEIKVFVVQDDGKKRKRQAAPRATEIFSTDPARQAEIDAELAEAGSPVDISVAVELPVGGTTTGGAGAGSDDTATLLDLQTRELNKAVQNVKADINKVRTVVTQTQTATQTLDTKMDTIDDNVDQLATDLAAAQTSIDAVGDNVNQSTRALDAKMESVQTAVTDGQAAVVEETQSNVEALETSLLRDADSRQIVLDAQTRAAVLEARDSVIRVQEQSANFIVEELRD